MHYASTYLAATDANADQASLETASSAKVCDHGYIIIVYIPSHVKVYIKWYIQNARPLSTIHPDRH